MFIFFPFVHTLKIRVGDFVFSDSLDDNLAKIREVFHNSSDLIQYKFTSLIDTEIGLVYINGMNNKNSIDMSVIKPLKENLIDIGELRNTIQTSEIDYIYSLDEVTKSLTNGLIVLFHENLNYALSINLTEYERRSVEQSSSEQVIKGPKEAFVEDLTVNKSLLRRIIKNNNLVFEDYVFGKQTNTDVSIVYMKNIVNPEILKRVKDELSKLKLEVVLDIHYIEENITKSPWSLINTAYNTGKPDTFASKILEGRIGIICDGSPNGITDPKFFIENIMSSEDYYLRPVYGSFLRMLRVMAFLISLLLPGVYIALSTFHHEMIPIDLLTTMANQRSGVPFSAFFEAIIMILFFEF